MRGASWSASISSRLYDVVRTSARPSERRHTKEPRRRAARRSQPSAAPGSGGERTGAPVRGSRTERPGRSRARRRARAARAGTEAPASRRRARRRRRAPRGAHAEFRRRRWEPTRAHRARPTRRSPRPRPRGRRRDRPPSPAPGGDLVEVVVSAAKGFSELDQSGGERCGGSRACLDVGRSEPATAATGIEPREQLFASPIDGVEHACGHRRRALATRSFHVSQQLAKAAERHAPTEPGSGALLQAVPLVEDDRIVLRQDAGAVARLQPDREIGEVERVVDDHELGIQRLCPRLFRIARRQERTPSARAAVGADGHLGPECRTRLERELGAVAVRRRSDPVLEALVLGTSSAVWKSGRASRFRLLRQR